MTAKRPRGLPPSLIAWATAAFVVFGAVAVAMGRSAVRDLRDGVEDRDGVNLTSRLQALVPTLLAAAVALPVGAARPQGWSGRCRCTPSGWSCSPASPATASTRARVTARSCLPKPLRKAVAAGEAAAAHLVVVDAIDDQAATFYAHHGFVAAPEHPMRLYRRMKDIRASLTAG